MTVGTTKQNFAIVPLAASGNLCLYSLTGANLKVDVLGYFGPTRPHTMVPSSPTRVVDTRDTTRLMMNLGTQGHALPAFATRTIALAGQRNIPAGASVLSVNVTAASPSGTGAITLWDCSTQPSSQSVNFRAGHTVTTSIQVQLSANGSLCMRSTATTHVIIDVTGWWI
jgi:hypothetical protein